MPLLLADRAHPISPIPIHSREDARMLGIRLSPDRWVRLRKGLYAPRQAFEDAEPWTRYAVRVHAFLRRHPDAVLCLESAAVIHGLPSFGEGRHIHVFDPDAHRSEVRGDVRVHASIDGRRIERVAGTLVTDLADTVVDLARVAPPAEGLAIADAALSPVQGGSLTVSDLADRSGRSSSRGSARMRWILGRADGRAESPHESMSRAVIGWGGFPEPDLQREFRYEGRLDRVDLLFEANSAIGEADGWQKYRLMEPDKAAAALAEEKRREDRLRRHGHPFARWEPADVWTARPIWRALEGAGVRRIRPPDLAMLATLRSRPRALSPGRATRAT